MSKESLVFTIGVIVFFTPFLGLPTSYKEWIFTATGVLLIITGYRLRRRSFLRSLEGEGNERRGDAFVENIVVTESEIKEEKEHTTRAI